MPSGVSDLRAGLARTARPSVAISAQHVWLAALAFFVALASSAARFHYLPGDLWVSHHLQHVHSRLLEVFLGIPETTVSAPVAIPATAVLFVTLWLIRRRGEAALVAMVPAGALFGLLLKELIERPRPSPSLVAVRVHAAGDSFPSGHVLTAVLLFGLMGYLGTTFIRRAWLRHCVQIAAACGVTLTGLGRIYDGVHWLSDVYGAMLLGTLILGLSITAQRRWSLRTISRRLMRELHLRVEPTQAQWRELMQVAQRASGGAFWPDLSPRALLRHTPCGLEAPAASFLAGSERTGDGALWVWLCPHCARRRSLTADPRDFELVRQSPLPAFLAGLFWRGRVAR